MMRPAVLLSLFFSIGIIIARVMDICTVIWLALVGIALLVLFIAIYYKKVLIPFVLSVCLVFTGAFWYSLSRYPQNIYINDEGLTVNGEGIISSYPKESQYGVSLIASINDISTENKELSCINRILLKCCNEKEEHLSAGDRIKFTGKLSVPIGSRNPGEFNYKEYLANQEIFYIVDCKKGNVQTIKKGQGIKSLAAVGREKVVKYLNKILPQRERGLLLGILFGDVSLVEEDEWDAYKRAGIIHLFAVSGYNVALVLGIVWFLLSFFNPAPYIRFFLGAVVLIGYYFLVGWSSSIIRASLMAFLGLIALTSAKKYDIYNSLGVAALIILILYPGELFQASFQLSFLVTAGMVYFTPWFEKKGFGKILSPTLAAQITSIPLSAYHFNQISLISPIVNVIAVLVCGTVTVLAFIGVLLVWFLTFLAKPFFLAAGFIMFLLSELVIWFADIKWACITVATPSVSLVFSIYLLLIVLPVLPRYRYIIREIPTKIKIAIVFIFTLNLLLIFWPSPKGMEVVFLDVGQGDSIFMKTPGGKTLLLDGGGTPFSDYPIGKNVVRPFLYHYGINKIDCMIMSHNDLDHSEGLLEILPYFQVGAFLMPSKEEGNETEIKILEYCDNNKIPIIELVKGQRITLEEDVFLEVLFPPKNDKNVGNNHSLIVRLRYKDSEWLFTGDAENEALNGLLATEQDIRSDVFKISHHGSRSAYNLDFYKQVAAKTVVISVGKNNFGQPHQDVIEYYKSKNIPVYITKEVGAVTTWSNGKKIVIKTKQN